MEGYEAVKSPDEAAGSLEELGVTLSLKESVYSDFLISPMVNASMGKGACLGWSRACMLMVLNLVLQITIVLQVGGPKGLVDQSLSDVRTGVFGKAGTMEGLCYWQNASTIPEFNLVTGVPEPGRKFMNCIPDEVFMLYDFSTLDLDGDGSWSKEEAWNLTKKLKSAQIPLRNTYERIRASIGDSAKNVKRLSAYQDNVEVMDQATKVLEALEKSPTSIPKHVLESQVRPFLDMCVIMDKRLCGNIIFRRSFNRALFVKLFEDAGFKGAPLAFLERNPHSGGSIHDVMTLCELATTQICKTFFSVEYQLWQKQRQELCGAPSTSIQHQSDDQMVTEWDELNRHLLTTSFEKYDTYKDTVLASNYQIFLYLILLLFVMSMAEEWRCLLLKWWIIPQMPSVGSLADGAVVTNDDGELKIKITGIPNTHRWIVILFSLVPRSLIGIFLLIAGSRYLVLSDGFESLIMNSLALTFLITVDEIVFSAFAPEFRRNWINSCEGLSDPTSARDTTTCIRHFGRGFLNMASSELLIIPVFAIVGGVLHVEYARRYGKFNMAKAFRCVCQVAGDDCTAAQILGGYPNLAGSPHFDEGTELAGSWFGV